VIIINDNLQNNSPKSLDNKYLVNGMVNYASVAEVNATIPQAYRSLGLTVKIGSEEYWYRDDITDTGLVLKIGTVITPSRSVNTINSLTGGGNLSADRTLQLVNDASAPGNNRYYGTGGDGTKGWFALPSGVGGEINTISNIGTGIGIYKQKTGVNFELKSLITSSPLNIAGNTNDVTINITQASSTAPGYLSSADWVLFNAKVNPSRSISTINSITGGGDLTADRTIQLVGDVANPGNSYYYGTNPAGVKGWYFLPSGSTGESNIGANLGAGAGIYASKTGVTLNFKSLVATGPVSVTDGSNSITVSMSQATSTTNGWLSSTDWTTFNGKITTATSLGTAQAIFANKNGSNLEFKSVDATAPLTISSTATTVTLGIQAASTSQNGYITSTDWNTFNNKVPAARSVLTTNSLVGGGDLSANRTLQLVNDVSNPGNSYYYGTNSSGVKGWYTIPTSTATAANTGSGQQWLVTPVSGSNFVFKTAVATAPLYITVQTGELNYNIQPATSTQGGYLTLTDWNTFNNKVPTTRTITGAVSITGGGDLSANRTLQLVGDVATPGNSYYYGTNSSGTKGWYTLPASGTGEVNTGSNLGTGVAVFKQKTGVNFEFRTLTSTAPIVITYNGTDYANIAINQGGASGNGYITSTDWTTFNNKVSSTRAVNTINSITGGGNLSADRTLQLVGDVNAPGSGYYYGTDVNGTKGFYPLPTVNAGSEFTIKGYQTFTYTETSVAGQLVITSIPPYTVWGVTATYLAYDVNSDQTSFTEIKFMVKSSFAGTVPTVYPSTTIVSQQSGTPYGPCTPNISSGIDSVSFRVIPGQVNTTKAGQKIIKVIATIRQLNSSNPN